MFVVNGSGSEGETRELTPQIRVIQQITVGLQTIYCYLEIVFSGFHSNVVSASKGRLTCTLHPSLFLSVQSEEAEL